MTKDEALKKVLVTLEWFEERKHLNQFDWQTQHIADIKEALAQPERPWVELTDAEIQGCYNAAYKVVQGRRLEVTFARAIEAKLKEKNI